MLLGLPLQPGLPGSTAPLRASLRPVLSYSLPRRWHPLPTEVPKEASAVRPAPHPRFTLYSLGWGGQKSSGTCRLISEGSPPSASQNSGGSWPCASSEISAFPLRSFLLIFSANSLRAVRSLSDEAHASSLGDSFPLHSTPQHVWAGHSPLTWPWWCRSAWPGPPATRRCPALGPAGKRTWTGGVGGAATGHSNDRPHASDPAPNPSLQDLLPSSAGQGLEDLSV